METLTRYFAHIRSGTLAHSAVNPFVLSTLSPFVLSPSKDQTAPAKPERTRLRAGESKAERDSRHRLPDPHAFALSTRFSFVLSPFVPFVLSLSKHRAALAKSERRPAQRGPKPKTERAFKGHSPRPFQALTAAAVALSLFLIASTQTAAAQVAPTITDGGVTNSFPDGMHFAVSADSDSPIQEIRLRYKILPDGALTIDEPDFDPASSISATLALGGAGLYLPPGTVIEYHWEATDADGDESRTETQRFFYDDVRFQWTPLESNGITVYYYSGSQAQAQAMLQTAVDRIQSMSQLLGAHIDFPIKVWIYDNVDDMRPALQRRSETYDASVITAGVRVASDTVLVLGNVSFDTLKHELTHVVTAAAGESPFGTLPAWLDEGTAVFGQDDPGGFRDAVEQAIRRGSVFSVRQITSYPGDPSAVDLFYGQSWSLVKYLNDTYGPEKFAQLFAEIKGGKRIDAALEAAYGFDQDGLDNEWRAANGLPARETPQPTQPAQPDATDAASGSQNEPRTEDDSGTSAILIIALAVGLIVLAVGVAAAGWTVAKRL